MDYINIIKKNLIFNNLRDKLLNLKNLFRSIINNFVNYYN